MVSQRKNSAKKQQFIRIFRARTVDSHCSRALCCGIIAVQRWKKSMISNGLPGLRRRPQANPQMWNG
jgi:hypothetical protein